MRWVIFVFFTMVLISTVSGADIDRYNAVHEIISDKSIVDLKIKLGESTNEFGWIVPSDASAIESDLEFSVTDGGQYKKILFKGTEFDKVNLKYITSSVIERTKDRFFILDLGDIEADKKSVTLKLPEKATLKYSLDSPKTAIIPKTADVMTDGKRIIINWDDFSKGDSILVMYNIDEGSSWTLPVVLGVVVLIILIAGFYWSKASAPTKSEPLVGEKEEKAEEGIVDESNITKNLFEEEKHIVELLLKAENHQLWQKKLKLESGLSNVKLSRKLRNLEQKGVIEKIPYGNTNKIRLKKDS